MNSASILMNVSTAAASAAPTADAEAGSCEGFTAALAALQDPPAAPLDTAAQPSVESAVAQEPGAEDVSALAIIASLLMQGSTAAANDTTSAVATSDAGEAVEPAAVGGVMSSALSAIVTAQNQADAAQMPPAETAATASVGLSQDPLAATVLRAATTRGAGARREAQDARDASTQSPATSADTDTDVDANAGDRFLLDKLQNAFTAAQPAANAASVAIAATAAAGNASGTAPQSVAAAVHLATTLTREGSSDVSAPLHATVREPVGSPRWAEEISSRLVLMSVRGQQEGSLTLTPEHLGPLEVQISVNKDTANVWFGAQHADTRAALTDAMPRLRELLAASGLSLGQSGVSEQSPRRAAADAAASRSGAAAAEVSGAAELAPPAWRSLRTGLIDTYA